MTNSEDKIANLLNQLTGCDDSRDADKWEEIIILAGTRFKECQEFMGNNGEVELKNVFENIA